MKKGLLLLAIAMAGSVYGQNALDFDGVDDYVQSSYPGVASTGARTIEAWINTTANCDPGAGGTQNVIVDYGTFINTQRFTVNVLWGNALRVEIGGSGLTGATALNDGLWHHIAVVYDPLAANTVSLYVDGNLDASGNLSVNTGNSIDVRVGRRIDDAKQFDGIIDEVRFWDVAKSSAEISASMSDEICTVDPNLKMYYNFNQGVAGGANQSVFSAMDLSGNSNDGTLTNMALTGMSSNWVAGASLTPGMQTSTQSETACDQYTWPTNGQTYTSGGLYSTTIPSVVTGCDSTVTLNLLISSPNDITENVTNCGDYTWSVNSQVYTASTTETVVQTNGFGCTYNHTLNLTINQPYESTEQITACDSYVWPVNDQTYSASGLVSETFTTVDGCDSVLTLDLTINNYNAVVTIDASGDLTTTGSNVQWLDCDNGFAEIIGENGLSFSPTSNGNYAVVETGANGCIDTSDCVMVNYLGLKDEQKDYISIYPNPNDGHFKIDFDGNVDDLKYEIRNLSGQLICTGKAKENMDLSKRLIPGVYFLNFAGLNNRKKIIVE